MTPAPAKDYVVEETVKTEKSIFDYLEDPKATATLPSLQSVLNELETLTRKSNMRLDEVRQLVEVDQGMSLRVLRMANSVYYSPSEPIMDLQDAILYIGLNSFRSAVASTRCIEKTCHIKQSVLDWRDFWTHAAGVGQLTMELAAHIETRTLPEESYYLMGLLHDIGKVVLAHLMPDKFNKIYLQAAREKKAPADLEMEHLGVDHGLLGAWYLEKQGIPLTLREPVRFHHASPLTEDKPHIHHAILIRMADLLTLYYRLGESGNFVELEDPFNSEEWKQYLKLCHPKADAKELRETLIDRVARVSDLVHKIIV